MQDALENTNANFVRFASNILATTKLINWDRIIPIPRPTANEIIPINSVSKNRIIDIFLLLIPRVK